MICDVPHSLAPCVRDIFCLFKRRIKGIRPEEPWTEEKKQKTQKESNGQSSWGNHIALTWQVLVLVCVCVGTNHEGNENVARARRKGMATRILFLTSLLLLFSSFYSKNLNCVTWHGRAPDGLNAVSHSERDFENHVHIRVLGNDCCCHCNLNGVCEKHLLTRRS